MKRRKKREPRVYTRYIDEESDWCWFSLHEWTRRQTQPFRVVLDDNGLLVSSMHGRGGMKFATFSGEYEAFAWLLDGEVAT